MESPGDPSNFEDWSVWRNFHEAGRLMNTHFHVFLPYLVYLLFPGSLIWAVYWQFLIGALLEGNFYRNLVLRMLLHILAWFVPMGLLAYASCKVLLAMETTVYVLDADKYRNGESIQGLPNLSGRERYCGRRSQAQAVEFVCFLVYIVGLWVTAQFGLEGVELVGMPEWTVFLITPLLAAGVSLVNLYLLLVFNLVTRLWTYTGQSTITISA